MQTLKVAELRAFIPARDFAESKKFYRCLGGEVKDVGPGIALVDLGGVKFYVQDYYIQEVAENCMLHLTVASAAAWHGHVAAALAATSFPAARVQAPKPQDYGALVTFVHDPSGVLLHFCEWSSRAGG